MSNSVVQWGDAECDMLVSERICHNEEYHNIIGRSRVDFWKSVARRIRRRYHKKYTPTQCTIKWKNLVQCYQVSKLKQIVILLNTLVNCDSSFRIFAIGETEQEMGGGQELAKDTIGFLEEMVGVGQVIINMIKMFN